MRFVFFGLTITSSWGNGHATTYRSLLKALAARGHSLDFVERDVEWYRNNRDMPQPPFCRVHLYSDWQQERRALTHLAKSADAVVIGSYVSDAIAVTRDLLEAGVETILFYDIDTPITISHLQSEGRTEYLDPQLVPHYAAYMSFTGGPLLREIEQRFGSPWAVPFYCSVDPEMYKPLPASEQYRCDLSYLGTHASDRQPKLMRFLNDTATLLPKRQFIVAGPQYPAATPWASNVKRIVHLAPPEHPAFYSSSRFTLNLTRDDMVRAGYSPSVRLFEASACGAAIISDAWAGLEEFLTPGEEILLPDNADQVAQILTGLSEEQRVRIGRNARERILSQHTAAHRAEQFEQIVDRCKAMSAQTVTASSASE